MTSTPDYIYFWVYISAFTATIVLTALIPRILAPKKPSKEKCSPYECGQIPEKRGWDFTIGGVKHYLYYALIFLVADVSSWVILTYIASPSTSISLTIFTFYLATVLAAVLYFLKFTGAMK